MTFSGQRDSVWGGHYKTGYIDPVRLPARHKWKYPNVYGPIIAISTFILMIILLVFLRSFIESGELGPSSLLWFAAAILLCCIPFLYALNSIFVTHEMEITERKVVYRVESLFSGKVYKDKLANFKGIYILEEERFKKYFWAEMELPETIFTILLYNPKFIGTSFPLYESRVKSIALTKAGRYSELLKLPVLDEGDEPIVLEA